MHCPHCHRNAWLSASPRVAVECRHCGTELEPVSAWDARFISSVAREMRAGRGRFTRDAPVRPPGRAG
jgi:ribosomal protein S27E